MHWWAVFELGINATQGLTWYSVGIFVSALLFGIWLLLSGKKSNKLKRTFDFLQEKISEKKAAKLEEDERQRQAEEYEKRVGRRQEEEGALIEPAIN